MSRFRVQGLRPRPGMTKQDDRSSASTKTLDRQLFPRHPPIRLQIALAGGVDDALRQSGRRRIADPAAGVAFDIEVVAQWLLVEARLRPARLIVIDRPD